MQQFFETFIQTDRHLSLEQVLQEARDTYRGHLESMIQQYRSIHKLSELDEIFDGEQQIVSTARACYEYAINGWIPLAKTEAEADAQSHDWMALAALLLSARYGIEFFSPEVDGKTIGVPVFLEQIYFQAILRARLDIDTRPDLDEDMLPRPLRYQSTGYLNLNEVAALAQMHQKSVRNATQPTAPDRLLTRKDGARTVVDSPEALRWLRGRRNFKPSELV